MPRPDFGDDQHAPTATATPSGRPDFGDQHPADDSGWMGSIGAGFKGAAKEAVGVTGLAPEWSKSKDPGHSTAEWIGREGADLAPSVALDVFAPEIGFIPTAGRLAKLANAGLNAGWKGALGGASTNANDRGEGAKTGAEVAGGGGVARAGWKMLPSWAKYAAVTAPGSLAGIASLSHEMGGGGRYISPWALHHTLSALAAMAAAMVKAPATTGAVGSQLEQFMGGKRGDQP
jgi:hypothetical protein